MAKMEWGRNVQGRRTTPASPGAIGYSGGVDEPCALAGLGVIEDLLPK
jgi:hypothetical protein